MPRIVRSVAACFASVFGRRRYERDLDEELQFHLEMEMEKNLARGMSPEAARREAVRAFGGVVQVKDDLRSLRGLDRLDVVWQDLRYALRSLLKSHGFTAVVILTLSLGIGAKTAVFSAVYAVLLKPLPYAAGGRLVRLDRSAPWLGLEGLELSVSEIDDLRRESTTLESVVEYHGMPFILLGNGEPERVQTGVVSASFFDVFGVTPHLGRFFLPSDETSEAEPVLVLSYEYWRERHGADVDIVGRVFEMNDRTHRVIGVLPPLPPFPERNDVYMPSTGCPFRSDPDFIASRTGRMMTAFATMKRGKSLEQTRKELEAIARAQASRFPAVYPESRGHHLDAVSLADELTAKARPTLLLLLATAGFVLLIACANVANVMLSRLLKRQPELALRAAIGASRCRIASQLLVESAVLTLTSGILGVALAWLARDLIMSFASRMTPRAAEISLDGTVLAFALGLSCLTALLFGVAPAFASGGRRTSVSVSSSATRRAPKLQSLLVVTEIAVSLVLLTGAGLMLRSIARLESVDPGYRAERVLSMLLDLDWSRYDSTATRAFHRKLLARLRKHPGVVQAGIGRTVPLARAAAPSTELVHVRAPSPGVRVNRSGLPPLVDVHAVSESYFDTIGASVSRGRGFTPQDSEDAPPVIILNVAAAREFCKSGDPVGLKLSGSDGIWHIVVGVVGDVRHYELDETPPPTVYVPLAQMPLRVSTLVVRTTAEPTNLVADVKRIVHDIDPNQAVAQIQTLEDVRYESIATPMLTTRLLLLFAIVALVIAAFGLGGALLLTVSQRTHELGMRLALGATPGDIRLLVLRYGWKLTTAGLALGCATALATTGFLSGLLFEVDPRDPATFGTVMLILAVTATGASFVAARRAANIDVLKSLRAE